MDWSAIERRQTASQEAVADREVLQAFDTIADSLTVLTTPVAGRKEMDTLRRKVSELEQQNMRLKAELYDAQQAASTTLSSQMSEHQHTLQLVKDHYKRKLKVLKETCSAQQAKLEEHNRMSVPVTPESPFVAAEITELLSHTEKLEAQLAEERTQRAQTETQHLTRIEELKAQLSEERTQQTQTETRLIEALESKTGTETAYRRLCDVVQCGADAFQKQHSALWAASFSHQSNTCPGVPPIELTARTIALAAMTLAAASPQRHTTRHRNIDSSDATRQRNIGSSVAAATPVDRLVAVSADVAEPSTAIGVADTRCPESHGYDLANIDIIRGKPADRGEGARSEQASAAVGPGGAHSSQEPAAEVTSGQGELHTVPDHRSTDTNIQTVTASHFKTVLLGQHPLVTERLSEVRLLAEKAGTVRTIMRVGEQFCVITYHTTAAAEKALTRIDWNTLLTGSNSKGKLSCVAYRDLSCKANLRSVLVSCLTALLPSASQLAARMGRHGDVVEVIQIASVFCVEFATLAAAENATTGNYSGNGMSVYPLRQMIEAVNSQIRNLRTAGDSDGVYVYLEEESRKNSARAFSVDLLSEWLKSRFDQERKAALRRSQTIPKRKNKQWGSSKGSSKDSDTIEEVLRRTLVLTPASKSALSDGDVTRAVTEALRGHGEVVEIVRLSDTLHLVEFKKQCQADLTTIGGAVQAVNPSFSAQWLNTSDAVWLTAEMKRVLAAVEWIYMELVGAESTGTCAGFNERYPWWQGPVRPQSISQWLQAQLRTMNSGSEEGSGNRSEESDSDSDSDESRPRGRSRTKAAKAPAVGSKRKRARTDTGETNDAQPTAGSIAEMATGIRAVGQISSSSKRASKIFPAAPIPTVLPAVLVPAPPPPVVPRSVGISAGKITAFNAAMAAAVEAEVERVRSQLGIEDGNGQGDPTGAAMNNAHSGSTAAVIDLTDA